MNNNFDYLCPSIEDILMTDFDLLDSPSIIHYTVVHLDKEFEVLNMTTNTNRVKHKKLKRKLKEIKLTPHLSVGSFSLLLASFYLNSSSGNLTNSILIIL